MPLRKARLFFVAIGALGALPMLWALRAEAASLRCDLTNAAGGGVLFSRSLLGTFAFTYSVACQGAGLSLEAESRVVDNATLEVKLMPVPSGIPPARRAEAFGYNSSAQLIPGCAVTDISPNQVP